MTEAETIANYFASLSLSDWSLEPSEPSDWLRLSVFLPSPVAMLWTCLEARVWLGPMRALTPDPRPEQMDLLILRWEMMIK